MARIYLIVIIFTALTGVAHSGIQLVPDQPDTEKYVNESFIVSCLGVGAKNTTWKGPNGKTISSNRGRVHVEERQDGDVLRVSLFFERIEREDRGTYKCLSNVNGDNEERTLNLAVVKPITMVAPKEQNATEFQNVVVKCDVQGDPTPSVVWHFQGSPLEGSKYESMPMGLRIANVSRSDKGIYSCRAFQIASATSNIDFANIKLNVLHRPYWKKMSKTKIDTAYGYLGGLVNLTCEADANPPANFTWYRFNRTITDSLNTTIINEINKSVLQFYLSDKGLLGDFECQARNDLGKSRKIIHLQLGFKPKTPITVQVVDVGATTARLDIPYAKEDPILGFRVQFLRKPQLGPFDWSHPEYQDVYKKDGGPPYIIRNLTASTEYVVRVAARNVAGLSDYLGDFAFETRASSASSLASTIVAVSLSLVVFTV